MVLRAIFWTWCFVPSLEKTFVICFGYFLSSICELAFKVFDSETFQAHVISFVFKKHLMSKPWNHREECKNGNKVNQNSNSKKHLVFACKRRKHLSVQCRTIMSNWQIFGSGQFFNINKLFFGLCASELLSTLRSNQDLMNHFFVARWICTILGLIPFCFWIWKATDFWLRTIST